MVKPLFSQLKISNKCWGRSFLDANPPFKFIFNFSLEQFISLVERYAYVPFFQWRSKLVLVKFIMKINPCSSVEGYNTHKNCEKRELIRVPRTRQD